MFGKLFSKKKTPPETPENAIPVNVPTAKIKFLGDIDGDITSLEYLRFEAGKAAAAYPDIRNAWFSKIQHAGEEDIRIAFVVGGVKPSRHVGMGLAQTLSETLSVDVVFAQTLKTERLETLRSKSAPLFRESLNLYVVPVIVRRGQNEGMPADWHEGIQMYIIAEETIDLALHRAVAEVDIQQFEMAGIYNNKILQIEVDDWWDDYVMSRFGDEKSMLPTQSDVEVLIKTGGLIRGLCLQSSEPEPLASFQ